MSPEATAKAAARMARAIEAAIPLIRDMWTSFPDAEKEGDDEVMTELLQAVDDYRKLEEKIRKDSCQYCGQPKALLPIGWQECQDEDAGTCDFRRLREIRAE